MDRWMTALLSDRRALRARRPWSRRGPAGVVAVALLGLGASVGLAQSSDRRDPGRDRGSSDGSTPGFLRPITELRPVGGDLRPVGGGLRPVGGNLGTTGNLRPIEIGSPLANERSFEARLRPSTTAVGVTGFAIQPGWDDPPWPTTDLARDSDPEPRPQSYGRRAAASARDSGTGGSALPREAAAGMLVLPGRSLGPATASVSSSAFSAAQASWRSAPERRRSSRSDDARVSDRLAPGAGDAPEALTDPEWDGLSAPALPVRRSGFDARPDVRMAVRLTLDGRTRDAVEALRHAVNQYPEAFTGTSGSMFAGDPAAERRLSEASDVLAEGAGQRLSAVDSSFMVAALAAARGDRETALAAIRDARRLGEDRDSGKLLHRVLSRAQPAAPAGATSPVGQGAGEGGRP